MSNEYVVICFTDLAGSTAATEDRGHEDYLPRVREFHRVSEALVSHSRGNYLKNTGDGDMIMFRDPVDAIHFAGRLIEYHQERSGLTRSIAMGIKIGLALGLVEIDWGNGAVTSFLDAPRSPIDAFGSGVNEAARVQQQSLDSWILVNGALHDALKTHWGPAIADRFLESVGKFALKGFDGDRELYAFDWNAYSSQRPAEGLAAVVKYSLQAAGVDLHQRLEAGLANPGCIIWPVVPRRRVTAIHRAQAEVIRLLAMLGWEPVLLLADCQSAHKTDLQVDVADFCRQLERYCRHREVRLKDKVLLSDLWKPEHPGYVELQDYFRRIASELTFHDIRLMHQKKYRLDDQDDLDSQRTLDNLRPTWAAAAAIAIAPTDRPSIVVAGSDEIHQWSSTTAVVEREKSISTVLIPTLNVDEIHQTRMRGRFPCWDSQLDLIRQIEDDATSNLPSWAFHMHCFLPRFPAPTYRFENGRDVDPKLWRVDESGLKGGLEVADLVRASWPILGPIPS